MKKQLVILTTLIILSQSGMTLSQTRKPNSLRVLNDGYPRAFFFRASEGPPARANPDYDGWHADFSRLMGIMGKSLDEEVLGRQKNNSVFFSRFKRLV